MGLKLSTETPIKKQGSPFSELLPTLKPFDLVVFSGDDLISNFIRYVELSHLEGFAQAQNLGAISNRELDTTRLKDYNGIDPKENLYSHCGIIITSEVLDHPLVKPGKVYIFESTMGGKYGYGINNVEGNSFLGVQLRDFEQVFLEYDIANDTSVAVARFDFQLVATTFGLSLEDQPLGDNNKLTDTVKLRFTKLFNELNGIPYDYNPLDLGGSIWSCLRSTRDETDELLKLNPKKWLFCFRTRRQGLYWNGFCSRDGRI